MLANPACLFSFFVALSKDTTAPLGHTHFSAEGEVSFKSVLFVPEVPPKAMLDAYGKKVDHIKVEPAEKVV